MKKYIFLKIQLISFLIGYSINAQIINITRNDSINLEKKSVLKDGNLSFYKNEYTLTLYHKENISYNKKNGYKYYTIAGGKKYCDKCKKEKYTFNIENIPNLKSNQLEIFNIDTLFENLKKYQFSYGYFYINNVYYKNLGMPIE